MGTGEAGQSSAVLPVAGWYRDPSGHADLRWWSGTAWTEATRADEPVIRRPIPAADERLDIERSRTEWRRIAASRRGIRNESPNTPAIWVIAVLPIPSLVFVGVSLLLARDGNLVVAVLVQVLGMLTYLALIVWERIALARQNLLAPSLWWQLIPIPLIYFLIRRIVLRRQGIISHAPGNLYAIMLVGSVLLSAATLVPPLAQEGRELMAQGLEERIAADFAEAGEQAVAQCPLPALEPGTRLECSVDLAGGKLTIPVQFEVQPDLTFLPVQYRPPRGVSS